MSNAANNPYGWREPVIRMVATEKGFVPNNITAHRHSVHTYWFHMGVAYVDDLEDALKEFAKNPDITQVRIVPSACTNPLPKTVYGRKLLDEML